MAGKSGTLNTWEEMVKKQLKTDDIYAVLCHENVEGISVKPFYTETAFPLPVLPKVEETTVLVASYADGLEGQAYAFLLDKNVEGLTDNTLYINNAQLAWHLKTEEENRYFSLVDVFNEAGNHTSPDIKLAQELLSKDFEKAICIDVTLHQNSGASIVQQLAMAMAKAKDLTELFGEKVLSRLLFHFSVGGNYFFEIAKIRAFKLIFNQLSKEFGLNEIPYIFVETSHRNKTTSDPENNLIRSALELSAAMIGGADAVFSNPFNLETQDELTSEISFKQQLVLAYESILNVFEDAAGGSYYVEEITRQFTEKAWNLLLEIEQKGGYTAMFNTGEIAEMVYTQAVKEQQWLAEGKLQLVGVTAFPKREPVKKMDEVYSPTLLKPVRLEEIYL